MFNNENTSPKTDELIHESETDQINTDNKMNKPPDDLKIPIIHSGNTSDSGHQTDSNSGSNPMTPNRFSFSSSFQIDNENSGEEEDDEETQEDEIMVFENSFEDDLENGADDENETLEKSSQDIIGTFNELASVESKSTEPQPIRKSETTNYRFSGFTSNVPSLWKAGLNLTGALSNNIISTSATSSQPEISSVISSPLGSIFREENKVSELEPKIKKTIVRIEQHEDDLDQNPDEYAEEAMNDDDDDETLVGELNNLRFDNDPENDPEPIYDDEVDDDEDEEENGSSCSPFSLNKIVSECPFAKFLNDAESPGSVLRQQACRSLLRALEVLLVEITKVTIEHNIKRSKHRFSQYCTAFINLTSKDQEPMVRAEAMQKVPSVMQTVYWELQRATVGTKCG